MARALIGAWLTAALATFAGLMLGLHPDAIRFGSTVAATGFFFTYKRR
jgi:hypothetical protein